MQELSARQFDPEVVAVGLEVLRDAYIPASMSQLPKSQMEQRRFSYFFSDKLTGLYNEDYLQILLHNNQGLREYPCLHSLHLHNLEPFNRRLGWEQGNLLMARFAAELQSRYPEALLFRVYSRDFVIITARHFDFEADALVFDSLKETGVTLTSSHVDLLEDTSYYLDKLEHLEIQCDLEGYR